MKIGLLVIIFLVLDVTCGTYTTTPAPIFNPLFDAASSNGGQLTNIINIIQQSIVQKLSDLSNIATTLAEEARRINKQAILEKTNNLEGTIAEANSKLNSVQGTLNNVNENVDSTQQSAGSSDGKLDEIKGTADEVNRDVDLIGTISSRFIERIGFIRQTTDEIDTRIDTLTSIQADIDVSTNLVQSLVDNLGALADLIEQSLG